MKIQLACVAIFLSLGLAFASDGFARESKEKNAKVAQAQEVPLGNADIVKLTKLDLGDDVIIAKINQAKAVNFDLGTDALIQLKSDGVSKVVISSMLKMSTPQSQTSSGSASELSPPPASSDEKAQANSGDDASKSGEYASCQTKVVTDSAKVVAGEGCKVKGMDGWDGEISGMPASGSKFTKLKIGMGMKQVTDLIGQPTDQGAYMTAKAWIPFYFGADKHRYETVYKNQGRLIFAGGSLGDFTSGHLVWIIHNSTETGYR